MNTNEPRSKRQSQRRSSVARRVVLLLIGMPVGAFYGFFVAVFYCRYEPVFGGALEGLRYGIPIGCVLGATLALCIDLTRERPTAVGRGQFLLSDVFIVFFIAAMILWLTMSFVVPAFRSNFYVLEDSRDSGLGVNSGDSGSTPTRDPGSTDPGSTPDIGQTDSNAN